MRKKPTDSPFDSGEWDAPPQACGNQKMVPVLWGLAFAIACGILAHMIVRFAGWLGGR